MDGIVGLGHFCETHGPCVILSTQRCKEEPQQYPHNLTVPWCESCQSIDLDQSLVCKDEGTCYVTTRTPLQQDIAFLLKQAVVRSLSCEVYLKKACSGIHLLNCWLLLTKNIKEIASDLQAKAAEVNGVEQAQCSQRVIRQAQGSPITPARSLSQLTGEPAVFAHLHMWFTWLLSVEPVVENPSRASEIPICFVPGPLRALYKEMSRNVFRKICYCVLTGIKVQVEDEQVLKSFTQLLPQKWVLPKSGEICRLQKVDGKWVVDWAGCLPSKLPKLQTLTEEALENEALSDRVVQPYVTGEILHWRNTARTLSWVPTPSQELFQSLGVKKYDLPLLAYWTAQCRNECKV